MHLSVIAFIAHAENSRSFTVALDVAFSALRSLETFVMLMNDGFSGAYFLVWGRNQDALEPSLQTLVFVRMTQIPC
jgi:hypothetical protein